MLAEHIFPERDLYFNQSEVCARLGIKPHTLYRRINDKLFPYPSLKLGRVTYWDKNIILRICEAGN